MNNTFQLQVKKIIRETEDAFTYVLENISNIPVKYEAGQFLTLLFTINGREVRRSFSLTSSPIVDLHMTITIKRLVNGELSRYLTDHLKVGDMIESLYPAGRFTLETSTIPNYFFIAAGSGITPIYSLIKTLLQQGPRTTITLLYSNTSEHSTIFYHQLKDLENRFPLQLQCIFLFSKRGERLSNFTLERLVSENRISTDEPFEFYVCGPFSFMRMALFTLTYMGFAKHLLHKEYFVSEESIPSTSYTAPNTTAQTVHILYGGERYSVIVPPYTTILDAALAQHIPLPYSCKTGMCSTCSAKCKTGKIEMRTNEVLTDMDVAQGWMLTCTSYPLSDNVEIDFNNL